MPRRSILAPLLAFALAACDDEPDATADAMVEDATADAMPDFPADAMPDATDDTMLDATTDATTGPEPGPCDGPATPAGDRHLGLDLLDLPAGGDFDTSLAHARALGVDVLTLHVPWSALEEAGQPVDPGDMFATFATVLDAWDLRLALTIRPIDLTGETVPADLADARYNDPRMTDRFAAVIDHVLGILPPERLASLHVGNEIDGFDASAEHPAFWSDYGVFLAAAAEHMRATHPGVPVGFTATFHGLTRGALRDLGVWRAYAGAVDVVGVTYYPLEGAFRVQPPDVVHTDLAALVAELPDRRITIQEIGYPTSEANGSTPAQQAEFFCHFFTAWDAHADAIPQASVLRLYDVSDAKARELAGPYGLDTPPFVEYLRTLGLRHHDGSAKPAFDAIRSAAERRGF